MRTLFLTVLMVVSVFTMISITANLPHDAADLEFALAWTQRAFGALIAVVAGLLILIRAASRATLEQLLPLTLAALIGVLIGASNWGVAVAIGAVGVAAVMGGRLSHHD